MSYFRCYILAACLVLLPLGGCQSQSAQLSPASAGPDAQPMFDLYQAGRLTTRILYKKAADRPIEEQDFTTLREAYGKLKIAPAYFQRIPRERTASYQATAQVMVIQLGQEIKAAYGEQGEQMQAGFGLGLQMAIVELELMVDPGGPSKQTREEIEAYVREILPANVRTARWNSSMLAFLVDFDRAFAAERGIPVKSRAMWGEMMDKLDEVETAKEHMRGDAGS